MEASTADRSRRDSAKDLLRPNAGSCPACHCGKPETVGEVPYHRTHLNHWNSGVEDFQAIVESDKRDASFELKACPECELIFVPETYQGFTDRVEAHPLFAEKTVKPYLDLFQNHMIDAEYVSRLGSDEKQTGAVSEARARRGPIDFRQAASRFAFFSISVAAREPSPLWSGS